MHIDNMNHEQFKEWFKKLDLRCLEELGEILTEVFYEKEEEMNNTKCAEPCVADYIMPKKKLPTLGDILGCTKAAPILEMVKQEETETTMCDFDERTEAQQAKDYLIKSLNQTMWNKRAEAEKTFNLDIQRPATVGELREAIKNGFFVVPEKYEDKHDVYYWSDFITYQDPAKTPDPDGYKAALKQIDADASDVKDQIVVFGPEKGLEALNAFKAKTFH